MPVNTENVEERGLLMNLEELLEQRREINEQIRALKATGLVRAGRVKLDKETFPTNRPDEYYVAIEMEFIRLGRPEKRWKRIVRDTDRQKVIENIPIIIKDLQELYAQATEEQ